MLRKYIEQITASLVVFLLSFLTMIAILMIANVTFEWDIFPPFMEKILYFISGSMLIVILSATLINLMINVSRLSFFAEVLARKTVEGHEKK